MTGKLDPKLGEGLAKSMVQRQWWSDSSHANDHTRPAISSALENMRKLASLGDGEATPESFYDALNMSGPERDWDRGFRSMKARLEAIYIVQRAHDAMILPPGQAAAIFQAGRK